MGGIPKNFNRLTAVDVKKTKENSRSGAFCSLTSFREEVRTTFGTAVGLGGATGAGRDAARSAPSSMAWYAALAAELFRTSGFAKVQREMKLFLEPGKGDKGRTMGRILGKCRKLGDGPLMRG